MADRLPCRGLRGRACKGFAGFRMHVTPMWHAWMAFSCSCQMGCMLSSSARLEGRNGLFAVCGDCRMSSVWHSQRQICMRYMHMLGLAGSHGACACKDSMM